MLVESGLFLVGGEKSKVTQGKVIFPGQLQPLGLKPEKAAIDFCSLLPQHAGAPVATIAGVSKRPPSCLPLFSVHGVHVQLIERLIKESTNPN